MDIQLKRLSFQYHPKGAHILKDVSLKIKFGESLAIIGPSGTGKSTLLKMINGLLLPQKGSVLLNKEPLHLSQIHALRRRFGYVMQEAGLFPFLTVEENITFMARLDGWDREEIKKRLNEVLDLVDLAGRPLRKRMPDQLSGGQRQRVSMARALFYDPPVLLLDEPFTYLDSLVSEELLREFLKVKEQLNKTIILVTHDLRRACRLADRICLLSNGVIEQDTSVQKFLTSPKSHLAKLFVQTLEK